MARELTTTQQTNVEAGATRPIYLVEWQHSGTTEYLSCSGAVTYDSQVYTAGGLKIASIEDSKTATIVLPATASRVGEIQNSSWRGGVCKITAILAAPSDTPTYSAADGLLMLDGVIESTSFSGETITVIAKCKYYLGAMVPKYTFNDVTSIIPAVGSISTWESENYSYEQWLKTTAAIQRIVRPGVNPQVTGRLSTSQANTFNPQVQTGAKLITAEGVKIPLVYGRASVPGFVFADGEYSGSKFIGVAWCLGEVYSIEKVFINDAEVPSTVTAKHYRGTTTQTVSPALQLYTSLSPQFNDDMILNLPDGSKLGICYSVFNIPTSAITGAPRFRAIIKGRIVTDPASSASDPYADLVEWSFNFLAGTTDSGPNSYTLTLNGNAGIASPSVGLDLDGAGDYATIPDGTAIGSNPFTLELEVQCDTAVTSPGTRETLICQGSTASPLSRSLQIDRVGDSVLLYLSSDGATWDICDGLSCGTLASSGSPEVTGRILVERVDNQISTYMNGATVTGVVTTSALYDSGAVWEIGACGGAQELDGRVRSARLTIGAYRYGSPHSITNTPFSDSGSYATGMTYSENPALAWKDLAENPVFGLGATTTGVEEAAAYCDSAMDSGAPRCRIGLAISEPRLIESWLDVLAMYANALWFPEGANLKIVSDKKKDGTNGSGKELYTAASPEVFGSPLPTVTTEDGASYSVTIQITAASTTSPLTGVSVKFAGVEVIANQVAVGTYGATVTAAGTTNTIEVIEEAGFNGTWTGLSVKRTHRLITQWLPSTLSMQGLPEGDKPNTVVVSYTVPDDVSGAWSQKTFGVVNNDVINGDPITSTTLDLPGVYRIEEASNKAIAKLYREDRKIRISLISTDEEVVCQPGDTIQPYSTYRGINTNVWVESSVMRGYGRYQITGTVYRDIQFPDTDYTEADGLGDLTGDGGYAEETYAGGAVCTFYACDAYSTYLSGVADYFWPCDNDPADLYCAGTVNIPISASNSFAQTALVPGACVSLDGWQRDQASVGPNASTLIMAEPDDHFASIVVKHGGSAAGLLWQTQRYWKTSGGVYTAWWLEIQMNLAANGTLSVTLNGPATATSPMYVGTVSSAAGAVPNDGLPHVVSYETYGMPGDSFLWHDTITVGVRIYVDWVQVADASNVINYYYNLGAASGQNASFDPTWPTAVSNNLFVFAKNNYPVFGAAAYNGTATFTVANALSAWNRNQSGYVDPNPACQ